MPNRPRKPWRVIITGPDARAVSDQTSEAKAYTVVRAALGGDSPAENARVEYWDGGLWRHFETVNVDEVP